MGRRRCEVWRRPKCYYRLDFVDVRLVFVCIIIIIVCFVFVIISLMRDCLSPVPRFCFCLLDMYFDGYLCWFVSDALCLYVGCILNRSVRGGPTAYLIPGRIGWGAGQRQIECRFCLSFCPFVCPSVRLRPSVFIQTYIQTDIHTDIQTYRQTDRSTPEAQYALSTHIHTGW